MKEGGEPTAVHLHLFSPPSLRGDSKRTTTSFRPPAIPRFARSPFPRETPLRHATGTWAHRRHIPFTRKRNEVWQKKFDAVSCGTVPLRFLPGLQFESAPRLAFLATVNDRPRDGRPELRGQAIHRVRPIRTERRPAFDFVKSHHKLLFNISRPDCKRTTTPHCRIRRLEPRRHFRLAAKS